MISLNDLQDLIGNSFFDGNSSIGGIVIYIAVLAVILVLSKNINTALILSLPVTLVFTTLGILSSDVSILLIIVTVLGLAYKTREVWRD